ncbi:hypothetical protein Tco_1567128, partial [Tanacetum coccineum]
LEDDQPFMVLSDEEEQVHAEPNAESKDTSVPPPQSPKSIKIQELTNQKFVEELEVQILGDLKELLGKMEEFQSSISTLTNKVDALEKLKSNLPVGLLALPGQVLLETRKVSVTSKL